MPTCKRCQNVHEADELVRHDSGGMVYVHCPDCGCIMGTYNTRVHERAG